MMADGCCYVDGCHYCRARRCNDTGYTSAVVHSCAASSAAAQSAAAGCLLLPLLAPHMLLPVSPECKDTGHTSAASSAAAQHSSCNLCTCVL